MNIGRSQKISVQDIVRTIAIEADIPAKDIGKINIYDKFTFVEVPEDVAEKVLGVMHRNTIKLMLSRHAAVSKILFMKESRQKYCLLFEV